MPRKALLTRLCLAAVTLTLTTTLFAVENSTWLSRAWQLDEGLPGNSVTGVLQTPDGYLWVATDSGLAKFDGAQFRSVVTPIPSGRTRPIIRSMVLGHENEIWLALEGGLVFSLSPTATNLFTTTNGLSWVRPDSIVQEKNGDVWTSYSDGTVCRIAKGHVTRFGEGRAPTGIGSCYLATDIKGQVWYAKSGNVGMARGGSFESLLIESGRDIHLGLARAGGMWVCAGLQLLRCDETGAVTNCGTLPVERSGVESTAVFEDRSGAVWIGTSVDGLYRYDGTNISRVETSHELILSLGEDNEGDVWVGTGGGGLDRLRRRVVELQTGAAGLPSALVRSICEDDSGTMWAATQNGGLARLQGGKWKIVTRQDGWPDARATCLVNDGKGGVWIGTSDGILERWADGHFTGIEPRDGLGGDAARAFLVDSAGDLWIAFESPTCLQRLHQQQFQTFTQPTRGAIRALAQDTKGTIWCGTTEGFLLRVDGDKLKNEMADIFSPPRPIRCLSAMPDGSVWIGFAEAGLGIWHNGKLSQIGEKQGLYDAYVCGMAVDDAGGFWCTTDHGIFQVPMHEIEAVIAGRAEQVHSTRFGRDEGLPNLQGSFGYAPGSAKSRDGRLWFPMRNGLAVVNPSRAPSDQIPPPVLIERVAVDGRPAEMTANRRFTLPPGHHRLDFDFTEPTFVAPENVRFRYRIEGWDENWNDAGTHRSATYSRLPAGDYTFCVMACNNFGVWSAKQTIVGLTVPPSVWERWPVRVAGLAAFTLCVIAAVRFVSFRRMTRRLLRLEQETALHRERTRIAQDLHDDIGASLTHIALLSELAQTNFEKPVEAKGHIDQIFHSARKVVRSLDEIVWTINPKNDTLDVFIAYLCTYAPEYLRSANVRCRLDVPMEVPAIPLPAGVGHHLYLAVKESLHNIVKHASATEVWLRLQLKGNTIILSIEDNGRGFQSGKIGAPDADGLSNLNRRLGEVNGKFEQNSEVGKGTTLKFTVPLKSTQA